MIMAYNQRSWLYKITFRYLLQHANAILIQGEEYRKFIEQKSKKCPVYYPNYVDKAFLKETRSYTTNDTMRLIYFGRISTDKGINIIVEVCEKLIFGKGHNCTLHLVGEGRKSIIAKLNERIIQKNLHDYTTILPPVTHYELIQLLKEAHFFVFPTHNYMEGHSNSLTEAMALGVVPICSDQGFNSSVVGDCGVVLSSSSTGDEYAEEISRIWSKHRWAALSQKSRIRVATYYNSTLIVDRLISTYIQLLEK